MRFHICYREKDKTAACRKEEVLSHVLAGHKGHWVRVHGRSKAHAHRGRVPPRLPECSGSSPESSALCRPLSTSLTLEISNKTLVRLQSRLQRQIKPQSCRFISIPFLNGRLPKYSNQPNFFDQGRRWWFSKEKEKKDKTWDRFLPYPNWWTCLLKDFLGKNPLPEDPRSTSVEETGCTPPLILTQVLENSISGVHAQNLSDRL